jgi:nucleolar protein 56
MPELVSAWYGSFLLDGARVVRAVAAPSDAAALAERAALRRAGRLTPEEAQLLAERGAALWTTRDRRLATTGVRWVGGLRARPTIPAPPDGGALREALLADADRSLAAAWDPSVHVEEAVRAAADLDRVLNLVGERLGSWVSRDAPDVDPGDHAAAARAVLARADGSSPLGPTDPGLTEARRQLAELYRAIAAERAALGAAVEAAAPRRTPNLTALLGPELASRMLAQAGGLDRLARLPSSTVQVLGAERAFFEHLRGRAPPPRHGLLFLHPAIQSAPRRERGRLARTLAGKVAIAARLDRAGAPVTPTLGAAFEARRAALRERRGTAPAAPRRRDGSRPPLDRAARDR